MKPPENWPDESCLTVNEAARMLRRHPEQVRRYLRERRFAGAVKVGLMWYVPKEELLAFAAHLRKKSRGRGLEKGAA